MIFLKKLINNKYQESFLTETQILKLFKKKNQIFKENNIKFSRKNIKYTKKHFIIDEYLWFLINKKKLHTNDKNLIFALYQKFSVNLKLKKNYNFKLVKINNKGASICSYIYLGQLILILKKINLYQKLNFLLKVNDLCVYKYPRLNQVEIYFLKKNIFEEFKLLKKCF